MDTYTTTTKKYKTGKEITITLNLKLNGKHSTIGFTENTYVVRSGGMDLLCVINYDKDSSKQLDTFAGVKEGTVWAKGVERFRIEDGEAKRIKDMVSSLQGKKWKAEREAKEKHLETAKRTFFFSWKESLMGSGNGYFIVEKAEGRTVRSKQITKEQAEIFTSKIKPKDIYNISEEVEIGKEKAEVFFAEKEVAATKKAKVSKQKSIFKNAWSIARKGAAKFGGSSKEYFAEALRMSYAGVDAMSFLAEGYAATYFAKGLDAAEG